MATKLHHRRAETSMTNFRRSGRWVYRVMLIAFGIAVFALGAHVGDFWGLLVMMLGIVPAIIGAGDVSLLGEIRHRRAECSPRSH